MEHHETRFRAMGTDCHIVVRGGTASDVEWAQEEVDRLEGLWTRFRADSELSRLNAAQGASMPASRETLILALRAVRALRLTGGWFDPFMGRDIVALGYDRDFAELLAPASGGRLTQVTFDASGAVRSGVPEPPIEVDLDHRTVRLPVGFDLDSGGIGKGLGADLVSAALLQRGVAGALVNLGGDLRCRGAHPDDGWRITIDDPFSLDGAALDEYVKVTDGAIATSTPLKRRWRDAAGQERTHLLHPGTGGSVGIEVASVTVIAPAGWLAEALAKALLVGGPAVGVPLLVRHRAAALVVTLDGSVARLP